MRYWRIKITTPLDFYQILLNLTFTWRSSWARMKSRTIKPASVCSLISAHSQKSVLLNRWLWSHRRWIYGRARSKLTWCRQISNTFQYSQHYIHSQKCFYLRYILFCLYFLLSTQICKGSSFFFSLSRSFLIFSLKCEPD